LRKKRRQEEEQEEEKEEEKIVTPCPIPLAQALRVSSPTLHASHVL
jgi:hypothetical protein